MQKAFLKKVSSELIKPYQIRLINSSYLQKKYYEGTGEHSLYKLSGIQLKYETIRRKKLFKELRENEN